MENPNQREHGSLFVSVLFPIVKEIVTFLSVGSMVVGGVVPYIPQFRKIRKTKDASGFSTYVCLVLLIANILRVYFWFGVHYELPLLAQSLIMIVCMLGMMHVCVTVNNIDITTTSVNESFFSLRHFWRWTNFWHYILFTLIFTVAVGVVSFMLLEVAVFVQLLGFASLLTEALLGTPQFWKNFKSKSTKGMSIQMVLFWTSGDSFKTVYFIVRQSPVQFWACGLIQVTIDILILSQVALYRRKRSTTTTSYVL